MRPIGSLLFVSNTTFRGRGMRVEWLDQYQLMGKRRLPVVDDLTVASNQHDETNGSESPPPPPQHPLEWVTFGPPRSVRF